RLGGEVAGEQLDDLLRAQIARLVRIALRSQEELSALTGFLPGPEVERDELCGHEIRERDEARGQLVAVRVDHRHDVRALPCRDDRIPIAATEVRTPEAWS